MEWVFLAIVGIVVLGYVLFRRTNWSPAPVSQRGPSRLSSTEMLARVRELEARNAQWLEIWSQLNPGSDSAVQQLLLDLRNDGLQFAPSEGLRKIELACKELTGAPDPDAVVVLRKVLGKTDVLDKFR